MSLLNKDLLLMIINIFTFIIKVVFDRQSQNSLHRECSLFVVLTIVVFFNMLKRDNKL